MPPMDEKAPNGSTPTNPNPAPPWFQQLLQGLAKAAPKGGMSQVSSPGVVSEARTPIGMPTGAPTPPVQAGSSGAQAPRIPQLPQVNQTAMASQGPLPMPQMPQGQTEFRTSGGKSAAIIQGAVQNIMDATQRFKMKQFQGESAQAEQIWGNYLALQSAIENEQDPQKKQQLQQTAQQLLQDKKNIKILEKAQKDPMSGAGVGMQRAIQGSSQRAMAQAQLEHVYMQAMAEQARAQQEQATANLRNRQTELEGQVTPRAQFDRETELMKFRQQMQAKGYDLEVRGLSPAVKDGMGRSWSWGDLQDPARAQMVPPDAARLLVAERQSKMQEIAEIEKRQQLAFGQQMRVLQTQLENTPKIGMAKAYVDQAADTSGNDMRYARMQHNAELAARGDQQAMNSLLADHVSMTLRQPGKNAPRPTLEQWKDAEQSRDLAEGLSAQVTFDNSGLHLKQGVVLTPTQINQMLELARNQHRMDWIKTYNDYKNAGLDPKKNPLPQTLPGLEVISPTEQIVAPTTTPSKTNNNNPLGLP